MTVDDFGNEDAKKGNLSMEMSVEGETPVLKSTVGKTPENVEGETPNLNVDGETQNLYVKGGTPLESEGATQTVFAEGEIPEKSVGETPKNTNEETPKLSKGETPTMFAEGEIPEKYEGDEIPVIADTQEPKEEGLKVIVDLADAPENDD